MARPNRLMPASRDAAERACARSRIGCRAPCARHREIAIRLGLGRRQGRARPRRESVPESAFVLDWHARWFQSQGRMTEAVEETERALALDPLSAAISSDAAAQYVSLEQLARAIPFAQKAVDLSPNDPPPRRAGECAPAGRREREVAANRGRAAQFRRRGEVAGHSNGISRGTHGRSAGRAPTARCGRDLPTTSSCRRRICRLAAVLEDWDRLFSWTRRHSANATLRCPTGRGVFRCQIRPRFDAFLAQMNLPAPEAH